LSKLRIVLADDHALVRAGIRALIESIPNVTVVGEAGNGREALRLVEQTKPDIALLDMAMPEIGGLSVTETISRAHPTVKVIILSMYQSPEFVMHAFRAGAHGYIVKDAASSELEAAIHAVSRGESYLSPAISRPVIASSIGKSENPKAAPELTARQQQVLRLLAEGQTVKEIAYLLGVSIKTVEAHRAQLMDRLKIHDLPGLVRYAMRAGLVPPEGPTGEPWNGHRVNP
jgi:DNA-binding NarL/FixJ family response regulator